MSLLMLLINNWIGVCFIDMPYCVIATYVICNVIVTVIATYLTP